MDFVNFMSMMIIILLLIEVNRMLTSTLETIRQAAAQANACEAQFRPFCQAIDNGNDLLAWQIVLENKGWLESQNIPLPSNLEELANGVGVTFHENGQLKARTNYKNDLLEGLYELFYENGQLGIRANYKNGLKEGLYELFYENGQLKEKSNWKNGKCHGLFESFYKNGQLSD